MIAISPRRPLNAAMVSAFHSRAHTPPLFVLQESNPLVLDLASFMTGAPASTGGAPKRKKPPRFPRVAPFLGIDHLLLERSPPFGVLDAILGLEDMARLGAHARTHGIQRVRVPGPCLLGSGQPGCLRREFRGPHHSSLGKDGLPFISRLAMKSNGATVACQGRH